jgi:hypothetical protein
MTKCDSPRGIMPETVAIRSSSRHCITYADNFAKIDRQMISQIGVYADDAAHILDLAAKSHTENELIHSSGLQTLLVFCDRSMECVSDYDLRGHR